MDSNRIRAIVGKFDTADRRQLQDAWAELRDLGSAVLPFFLEAFPRTKKSPGREAMVFHAIKFARTEPVAFELGLLACRDRAHAVRYRGCGLLAYSLNPAALPALEQLVTSSDARTREDAGAAIDAIRHRNHHLFVDRQHTGSVFWEVGGGPDSTTN